MFRVSQCGLTGTGETIYGSNKLGTVSQCVFFLSAVACRIAVSVSQSPCHGQCTFLMLTKVFHTKDRRTVLVGIKVAQCQRIAQAAVIHIGSFHRCPLGIGKDIDIRLIAASDRLGFSVHLHIFIRHILEVDHPVIQQVLFSFRNQKVSLCHKFRIKAYEAGCVIHLFPASLIDRIHHYLIQFCFIYAGLAFDAARCCVTAGYRAVIEQKNLCVLGKAESLAVLYRHIRYDCSRRIFS